MDSPQDLLFKKKYPTLEQNKVLLSDAPSLLIRALAGTGKTTTLALKAADLFRAKGPDARILMLAHSQAGVAAIKARLVQFLREIPRSFSILTLEQLCSRLLKEQGDPVVELSGSLQRNMRIQQAQAALLLDLHEAGEAELVEHFSHGVDLRAFQEFEILAKQRMLIQEIDDSGQSARQYCEEMELDYPLYRLLMKYERLRVGLGNEALFYAPGDCTYGFACQLGELDFDGVPPLLKGRYDAVLFDELQDLNEAALLVLRALVRGQNGTFVGVGDFNQHILSGAISVFGDSLSHLLDSLPAKTEVFSLNTTYRFGKTLCDALNQWFGVEFDPHYQRKGVFEALTYQTDMDCVSELLRLHAKVQQGLAGVAPTANAVLALNVILRSPADSVLVEWTFSQEGVHYACKGMQRFYQRREIAMVLALMWAAGGSANTEMLSQSILQSAIQGLMRYFRRAGAPDQDRLANGQFDDQAFGDWPDDLDATAMAAQLFGNHKRMRAFLAQLASYRRDAKGENILAQWLELSVADIGSAQALCQHELIAQIFRKAPVSRSEFDACMESVQALSCIAKGLSVDEFLGQLTLMVRSTIERYGEKEVPTLQLLSVEECKGHEYDFVAVPFVERGRFPRSAAPHEAYLERNRLYVAMSRARKCLWVVQSKDRPVGPDSLAAATQSR